jgi:hypothetical protein
MLLMLQSATSDKGKQCPLQRLEPTTQAQVTANRQAGRFEACGSVGKIPPEPVDTGEIGASRELLCAGGSAPLLQQLHWDSRM